MKDRFDLESDIFDCWRILDDMRTLQGAIEDSDNPLTDNGILDALKGMYILYNRKFEVLFDTFQQTLKLDKYHEEDEFSDENAVSIKDLQFSLSEALDKQYQGEGVGYDGD